MSGYRVTLQFDLDINDDQQAKAAAAAQMHRLVQEAESEGGSAASPRGESPEVAIHGMTQSMRATASIVAVQVLAQGAGAFPWLRLSNIKVENEQTHP